jgi:hypothetical protein
VEALVVDNVQQMSSVKLNMGFAYGKLGDWPLAEAYL